MCICWINRKHRGPGQTESCSWYLAGHGQVRKGGEAQQLRLLLPQLPVAHKDKLVNCCDIGTHDD